MAGRDANPAPRGLRAGPRSCEVAGAAHRGIVVDVKELPDDLAQMEAGDLTQQGAVRDERLDRLFRRWPTLSRVEMGKLKALYGERLRIARQLGRLRRGRSSSADSSMQ